jgi:dihydrofolate synthase/folylpolyglutamate synthase
LRKLHEKLGSPAGNFKIIHVTGTNGKGTVCLNIAKGLQASGFKTALFTSPHYERCNERISINGEMISDERMERIYQAHKEIFDELMFFELFVLMALIYFSEEKVSYAVIEVGIGGLNDSTNILTPILSVITNITLDHQDILGDLDSIARNKAGIIKEGVPVVLGPWAAHEECYKAAFEKNATIHEVLITHSDYLKENKEIANKALEVLNIVPLEKLFTFPARFEIVDNVVFDMAHNEGAFLALKRKMQLLYPDKKIIALWNMATTKDVSTCLSILKSFVSKVYFLPVKAYRLMSEEDALSLNLNMYEGQKGEIILVCGSMYLMAPAKKILLSPH